MKAARDKPIIDFDGDQFTLFPDLSRRTLMQRRAARPLLKILRSVDFKYRWGFPFHLTAFWHRKTAVLRTKDDLQYFVETLALPKTDFSDWRLDSSIPSIYHPKRWQQVPVRSRHRNRTGERGRDVFPTRTA